MQFEQYLGIGRAKSLERVLHTGDVLTAFVLRLRDLAPNKFDPNADKTPPPFDFSQHDVRKILFQKPSGVTVEVDAGFTTLDPGLPGQVGDGTDGYLEFSNTDETFWDEPGWWKAQARLEITGQSVHRSQTTTFEVRPHLQGI